MVSTRRDAELGERLLQPALGHLDAVDQRVQRRVAAAAALLGHRLDGAAQIVADRQHVAGEGGDRVLARVGDLALGAPAQVLHLGQRAQELVLHVGDFGLQRGRWVGGRRGGACVVGGRRRFGGRPVGLLLGRGRGFVGHHPFQWSFFGSGFGCRMSCAARQKSSGKPATASDAPERNLFDGVVGALW